MKWTTEQIQELKKKAYGNFLDGDISQKVNELNFHLDNYERSFLSPNNRHHRAEVGRLADEISI